jgi:hypothetical protein
MSAQRFSIGWIFKIAIWCLIVGVALSALGVTPGDFWNSLWDAANRVYEWGVSAFGWAWDYILIGGAIVLPIVIIRYGWRSVSRR